jgi:GMP synthase (glutamine-hydrolysing)
MKHILLIQSRSTSRMIASELEGYKRVVGAQYAVEAISSLDTSLSWDTPEDILEEYDGVILGGSGDFDFDGGRHESDEVRQISQDIKSRMHDLVHHVLQNNFPLLGICFGHQIVGEVLGIRVVHDKGQTKVGTHEVRRTKESETDPIFSQLPESFFAQYAHKDSFSEIPKSAIVLAQSDCCRASALRFGEKAYTMQFHPELTHEEIAWKLQNISGYLPKDVDIRKMIQPSHEASRIIPSFLETVVG